MINILRILILVIFILPPLPSIAGNSEAIIEKKPVGLKKSNPYKSDPDLTAQDRLLWKSVLHWCDECDERARGYTDNGSGRVYVYPLSETDFLVEVDCFLTNQQYEALFYKVKENRDMIESRLLQLEQFEFLENEEVGNTAAKRPQKRRYTEAEKGGQFVRFKDALTFGLPKFDQKRKRVIIERRFVGVGGCGFMTEYDVSGDTPKIVEFRANTDCSTKYAPPKEWKLYSAKQRAKWRFAPNPQREEWKNKDQCR